LTSVVDPHGARSTTDVVIIGAGASGGVVALRLVTAGFAVTCLEQGEWPDRASFRGSQPDWELNARKQWSGVPGVRQNPADYPIDCSESDIAVANFNGVGGGTVLYNAQWPRMLPEDFAVRSREGIADDWPLDYAELKPFYERVDQQFGVSGLGGNPFYPEGPDPPLPPLPIGESGLWLARAHARLGWHWWPETNAILSAPYAGRHPCVQRGACAQGCNEGAKSSTDLTHWPEAIRLGCQLVTGAIATRITLDKAGLATGVEWRDRHGADHHTSASVVLCASNGVGTARLLLASASAGFPDGLANRSGLVGRRLMMHPMTSVTGYFDEDLASWRGQSGALISSLQFYKSDPRRGFSRGARWASGPTGGPFGLALAGRVWGAEHHAFMEERFGRGARWGILCEDLPDEENRVTLTDAMDPRMGLPIPAVRYRVGENTRLMQDWHQDRAIESMTEAGARFHEVERFPFSGHLLGTARMGNDPHTSVVNRWGLSHDVANLGVIDGSVFVTAGGMNPTSTICALALRTADYLVDHRADIAVPESSQPISVGWDRSLEPVPTEPVSAGPVPAPTVALAPTRFGDEARERLASFADVLIPHGGTRPSAREVGVADGLLNQVMTARPDLVLPLSRALAEPFADAGRRLEQLRREDRSAHRAVITTVAGGYYMDPGVRRGLGYPGQEGVAVNAREIPAYVLEGLLDSMLEAG
jgi:choline dehydrogenase-like flavoprotein